MEVYLTVQHSGRILYGFGTATSTRWNRVIGRHLFQLACTRVLPQRPGKRRRGRGAER